MTLIKSVKKSSYLKVLKCPKCGGALTQHIPTAQFFVCPHCNSPISLSDDVLKVIGKKTVIPASPVPIKVGQIIPIREVRYFVLGRVLYEGRDDEDSWQWTEWLLGSSDGQLKWLSYYPEEGFILYQKLRIREEFDAFKAMQIPVGNGEYFWVNERYLGIIIASEGELTFLAPPNTKLMVIEGAQQDKFYSIQRTATELEMYVGISIAIDEIATAVNDTDWIKKAKKAQNISVNVGFGRVFRVSGIFAFCIALVSFVLWMAVYNVGEVAAVQEVVLSPEYPSAIVIANFTEAYRPALVSMEMVYDIPLNSYAEIEFNVSAPEDDDTIETFIFEKEIWNETGVEDGEVWYESDYSGSGRFIPTQLGDHEIEVSLGENTLNSSAVVRVTVHRNQFVSDYYLIFAGVVGLVGILFMSIGFPGFLGGLLGFFGRDDD